MIPRNRNGLDHLNLIDRPGKDIYVNTNIVNSGTLGGRQIRDIFITE